MSVGPFQLLIILLIVFAIFGTKKLRSFGEDLGSAIKGFREAVSDDKSKEKPAEPAPTVIEHRAAGAEKTAPARDKADV